MEYHMAEKKQIQSKTAIIITSDIQPWAEITALHNIKA